MTMRKLAGTCDDLSTCPGVWEDATDLIVVGVDLDPAPVPLGDGERAVRISRELILDAVRAAG